MSRENGTCESWQLGSGGGRSGLEQASTLGGVGVISAPGGGSTWNGANNTSNRDGVFVLDVTVVAVAAVVVI